MKLPMDFIGLQWRNLHFGSTPMNLDLHYVPTDGAPITGFMLCFKRQKIPKAINIIIRQDLQDILKILFFLTFWKKVKKDNPHSD